MLWDAHIKLQNDEEIRKTEYQQHLCEQFDRNVEASFSTDATTALLIIQGLGPECSQKA
jgi:hypothetical protein